METCKKCGHNLKGKYYKVIVADFISQTSKWYPGYTVHRNTYLFKTSRDVFICDKCKLRPKLFRFLTPFVVMFTFVLIIISPAKFFIYYCAVLIVMAIVILISGYYTCDERSMVRKDLQISYFNRKIKCFTEEEWKSPTIDVWY